MLTDEAQSEIEQMEHKANNILPDRDYKVFFGSWEVVDVVEGSYNTVDRKETDRYEEYIGMSLYFDQDTFMVNDEVVSNNVYYSLAMIPSNEWDTYFHDSVYFYDINDIIPQDQNYFTFVSVQGENIGYPVGDCFYIYDLDTIIIETTQGDDWLYLKCERTGYVEDYKLKIEKP